MKLFLMHIFLPKYFKMKGNIEMNIKTKKYTFIGILLISMLCIVYSFGTNTSQVGVILYFTDAQVMKLIPIKTTIPKTTPNTEAKTVLNELIKGRDDNLSIYRTIPNIKRGMTVKVKGQIAYVNIKSEVIEKHINGRDIELLTVYSIVNSLASIEGINNVRFTIDGKKQKDFMGYIDMRETFIPDYMI